MAEDRRPKNPYPTRDRRRSGVEDIARIHNMMYNLELAQKKAQEEADQNAKQGTSGSTGGGGSSRRGRGADRGSHGSSDAHRRGRDGSSGGHGHERSGNGRKQGEKLGNSSSKAARTSLGQRRRSVEAETEVLYPPRTLQESREKMNMMRMPEPKEPPSMSEGESDLEHEQLDTNRSNISKAPTTKAKKDDSNVTTIKSFLTAFGFQRKKKHTARFYEDISYEVHLISLPWFMKILAAFAPIWEWCMFVMGLASFFIITILSIFSFYVKPMYDTVYCFDVIFGVDTIVRVAVEVWRCYSRLPCIVFITPYTLNQFVADICSILPLERIYVYAVGPDDVDYLKYFDFFRYNRFIRLMRLFSFLTAAKKEQRISERIHFFVWYFTMIVSFIQFVACVFYLSLPVDPIDFLLRRDLEKLKGTWIGNLPTQKPGYQDNFWHHYVLGFSFSTAVVTTVGYGDMSPTSEKEMMFGIVAMLIGAIFLTGLFSSGLTSFELEHDGARFDLFFRVDALMKHLKELKATPFYCKRVQEYYNLLWNYREGVYNVELFNQLPKTMQEEIWYDICEEMFHKSALFRGLEQAFLRALSRIAKPVLYNANMILCIKGKYAMRMAYIIQGEVLVRAKYKSDKPAAILRPGCIFGEMNLFFSYPYTTNVETRTCCQLLVIEKESLFDLLSLYPNTLKILRGRVQERLRHLHQCYRVVGEVPLYWVELAMGHPGNGNIFNRASDPRNIFPVTFRKGTGWNSLITHDIVDDSRDLVVVEMPCLLKKYEKVHTTVYKSAVIPNILISEDKWVQYWNIAILLLAMYGAFLSPYCLVFKATSQIENTICSIDAHVIEWFVSIIYIADVFVEIANSAPVTGLYYKFKDGISLKFYTLYFWMDVLSAIPLNLVGSLILNQGRNMKIINITGTALRCLKLWKVFRYFNYLDNVHYTRLFALRITQTLLVLVYFTHFLACIIFMIACPSESRFNPPVCKKNSWLRSYEVKDPTNPDVKYKKLSQEMPYLLSFYFAAATLSSAGFGDFNPQNSDEILLILLFELISFTIIGYYTAILTSALSCTIRPQLVFQQKLLGIKQFMEHQGISEDLQHRVVEHYHLQNILWAGVTLPENLYHFMYDAPDYLREDSLMLEVEMDFEGVPLLTKVDPKIIVRIAELVRRYLIPPNSIFLRKGEVRRQMYVIGKGAVGILNDKTQQPERILKDTSHFGIRDLLFGEPAHNHIKTLSYCVLYEIEYHDLDDLFDRDPQLTKIIEDERKEYQKDVDEMTKAYAMFKTVIKEKPKAIESWILFPKSPTQNLQGLCCPYHEYNDVFKPLRFKWMYLLLMHKTVHPAGLFAKVWVSFISLLSCFTLLFLLLETFAGKRDPTFRAVQYGLDMFNYIDIYIKLHWAFYNKQNLLISHPARTALRYIYEGEFLFDVLFSAPFEFIFPILTNTNMWGYSLGVHWFSKMRWTRLGQVLRIPAIVNICNNIFTMRNETLVLLYIALTLVLCTTASCFALSIACPIGAKIFDEGDQFKLPFCLNDGWATKKADKVLIALTTRLIYGIYYTSNVIFAIGFGDLITLRRPELVLVIVMMVFGFMVDVCILANITAAEVDIDENRAKYLQSMECLDYILYKEKVNKNLRRVVSEHLQHTWVLSQGLQPKTLFVDLHPALESDLFREYVGELLKKVPIFSGLKENVVRTLCQYMKKHYFLKGQAMMRAGNLEPEMYVIVAGKVWITDRENQWICTLRSSETFGETSMLYGSQRRYSAYAGSAVEAFCLTRKDYNQVLERYPIAKDELESKVVNPNEDLFERKVKNRVGLKGLDSVLTTISVKKNSPRAKTINAYIKTKQLVDPGERESHPHAGVSWWKRVGKALVNSGADDEKLSFLYFAKRYASDKFTLLIHPECMFMKLLSFFVVVSSFFTPMMATYEMSFTGLSGNDQETDLLLILHIITEIPMYLHIFLEFITPFRIEETQRFCKEPWKIVYNYVFSPTRFGFNIIAIFPIPFVFTLRGPAKYLHLLRMFRLVHFYKALVAKKDDLGKGIVFYKISVSLSSFMLIIHLVSCFVYEISPCYCYAGNCTDRYEESCPPGRWTHILTDDRKYNEAKPPRMEPYQWYIRAFYWVTSTVSTTGFGDIVPITIPEILSATLSTFIGAFVLAIILSQFTSGISTRTKAHREYLYQVNLLSKHLGNIGTSQHRRNQVLSYFVTLWENSRGVPYHEAVSILPMTMQIEVNFFLYYRALKNCTLFYRINDRTFLRQVCVRLKHTFLLPGSIIVNDGDQGTCLYIVFKGVVTGFTTNSENGVPIVSRQYHRGNVFGTFPALFYDQAYNKSYRTETSTEVLSLSQEDLIELKEYFPDFAESLQFLIIRKYNPEEPRVREAETIFQKRRKKRGLFSLDSNINITAESQPKNIFEESKANIEIAKKETEKQKRIRALNVNLSSSSSSDQDDKPNKPKPVVSTGAKPSPDAPKKKAKSKKRIGKARSKAKRKLKPAGSAPSLPILRRRRKKLTSKSKSMSTATSKSKKSTVSSQRSGEPQPSTSKKTTFRRSQDPSFVPKPPVPKQRKRKIKRKAKSKPKPQPETTAAATPTTSGAAGQKSTLSPQKPVPSPSKKTKKSSTSKNSAEPYPSTSKRTSDSTKPSSTSTKRRKSSVRKTL